MKLQNWFWILNGTQQAQTLSRRPEGYGSCVQIQDIWFKCVFDEIIAGQKEDFLTVHNSFASTDILLKDNVTLYSLNHNEAVFVKTASSINVYDGDKGSGFLRIAQYRYATQVLLVPLEAFYKFAEDLGKPKAKVLFVSNTGRCGSTILSQIFEATGKCLSITEPMAFQLVSRIQETNVENYSRKELQKLVSSIMCVLCKPQMRNYSYYIVKLGVLHRMITPLVMESMPEVSELWLRYNFFIKI